MENIPVGRYIISFEIYENGMVGDFEAETVGEDIELVSPEIQQLIESRLFLTQGEGK